MIRTTFKFLRFSFYALLVLLGVTFAVSNRTTVELTFFPLPYSLSVPMFIVAIVLFSAGVATAWAIMRVSAMRERSLHRKTIKRMQALENEIAALRSEQLLRQDFAAKPLALAK